MALSSGIYPQITTCHITQSSFYFFNNNTVYAVAIAVCKGREVDPVVRIKNYSYAYPDAGKFSVRDINLEIEAGQCHCVGGPTGSGKTTLALAIKRLLPPGNEEGRITGVCATDDGGTDIGIVLQNPEIQILASSIGAEIAFGLENLCVDPAAMPALVKKALDAVGLDKPIEYETASLSMGQKYRLILASHLVMNPKLLILDEPAGQLDPDGLEKLLKVIQTLKNAGMSFLLFEHNPEFLSEIIDVYWHLDNKGHLRPGRFKLPTYDPSRSDFSGSGRLEQSAGEIVCVRKLTVTGAGGSSIFSDLFLNVAKGRRVTIYGANGTGKTTLLRCLAGFVQASAGDVLIFGKKPVPGNLRGKVGCLFQNPQQQLFEDTVFDEVAFPLRRFEKKGEADISKIDEMIALCGIGDLAGFSPHKLSYGQKHLVALASVLAGDPELLLLDDPFAGLDQSRCEIILNLLSRLNEKKGLTVIWACHNPGMFSGWADLEFLMERGKIVAHTS
jgi:energy-coupling factor transport system ATP-binding protein